MSLNQSKSLYYLRKTPAQARSKATVNAILEAATRLLLSIGYEKTSTNRIAELANKSVGSLYEYFPGKEAVFAEIRRRESRRHYSLILAGPAPSTLHEMLRLQTSTYIKFVLQNLDLHTALIQGVPQFAIAEADSKILADYFSKSVEFLGVHRNSLRPQCELPIIVELVSRVLRSTIDDYALHAPERLIDKIVTDELLDMLDHYLLR